MSEKQKDLFGPLPSMICYCAFVAMRPDVESGGNPV